MSTVAIALLLLVTGCFGQSVCQPDMDRLLKISASDSVGKSPDGRCYAHVSDYIDQSGYGGIEPGHFDDAIPPAYWAEAHDFADYLNKDGNAARLNLLDLGLDNPYKAPAGAIVVVRAGTPGTYNPTAGDIAVKGSGDIFYNGGEMGYHGSSSFPPGNDFVLGIYVPTKCSGGPPSPPSPGGCKYFQSGLCPGDADCMCTLGDSCAAKGSNGTMAANYSTAAGACAGQCRRVAHNMCPGSGSCLMDTGPC